ncbi:MAG: NAD(P)/FAD-dependent oxidoreductase [Methanomassiliicoccaceae archaeon]|nr:NAD(P)/FAD-dependent oxidoreductase [Methanomassiliicoccaceae archaeon]
MHDVIVIGGGPVGNKAASILAKDHDVLVVEDHDIPGRPVQCTGLVSDEVIKLSGVRPTILNRLYGANVFFPSGQKISVRSKEHKAVLIDRAELDAKMAGKAEDDGAKHMYSTRYITHRISDGKVKITTSGGELSSSMIIGADGHNSAVARTIPDNEAAEYLRGIQADVRYKADDPEMIDIHIGSNIAPGFFAWAIPFDDMLRVGLCTSHEAGPPSAYLKSFLKRIGADENEIVSKYCGKIPLGGRRRTYADNLLLIGDAACHVKPISGGGLQPAFRSVYALAETISEAFDELNFSEKFLSVYEKRWKRDVGKELKRGYRLRKMYTSMSDTELDHVSDIIGKDSIIRMLNGGDIDHPSDLLFGMMRHPITMLRLAPLMIKANMRCVR